MMVRTMIGIKIKSMRKISFSYLTLFPELIRHYLSDALLHKSHEKGLLDFNVVNLRDFSKNKYKSVDDTAYGGSDGMVIEMQPLLEGLKLIKDQISEAKKTQVIYLSPQGQRCDHEKICELATYDHLIFISGRYAGVDQRFISEFVDQELSIGDYVLSGGELPSLVLTESISRQIPGVLGDQKSAEQDSFSEDLQGLLEAPQFTKPQIFNSVAVPEVLISGHHQKISEWKKYLSILVTLKKRPDLVDNNSEINWLMVREYYKIISDVDKKTLNIENLEDQLFLKTSACSLTANLDAKLKTKESK
jgi:tRNA (guanine37-N1)-methyltransferase